MAGISEADKLGMASLIASTEGGQSVNRAKKSDKSPPLPRPRPVKRRKITAEDITSGRISAGDANDEMMIQSMQDDRKANGGMIDRAAIRGKTKGKIC